MDRETQKFVERMGRYFEADGVPRISGRLFGFLLLQAEPCSLDDLAETLRVSKASVSTNARLLENLGILERTTEPGDRRDYYQVNDDMHQRMLERRLERMRQMRALIAEALQTPAAARDAAIAQRLRVFDAFHQHGIEGISEAVERVRRCGVLSGGSEGGCGAHAAAARHTRNTAGDGDDA